MENYRIQKRNILAERCKDPGFRPIKYFLFLFSALLTCRQPSITLPDIFRPEHARNTLHQSPFHCLEKWKFTKWIKFESKISRLHFLTVGSPFVIFFSHSLGRQGFFIAA